MPVFYIQFTLMNRNVALCDELQQLVSQGTITLSIIQIGIKNPPPEQGIYCLV